MSSRLCPRCSSVIESESAIFCYNCGQELDRSPEAFKSDSVSGQPLSPQHPALAKASRPRGSVFYSVVPALLFLVLVISLFLIDYFGSTGKPASPYPVSNEAVSTVSALPVAPFDFGKYPFPDLVPAPTSLYLESSNPRVFLQRFLSSSQSARLESLSGLNLLEIASFFEPNFAFVQNLSASPSASALIGVGKDLEFVKERVAKIGSQTNLVTAILGPYFVVSDSSQFLKDIGAAYAKTGLALSATASFSEAKKHLPTSGQVFIYGSDLPSALKGVETLFGGSLNSALTGLRGTSFVITIKSGSTAIEGANDQ